MNANDFLQTLSNFHEDKREVHCFHNSGDEIRFAFLRKDLFLLALEIGNKGLFPWSIDPTFKIYEGDLITIPLFTRNIFLEGDPVFLIALLCVNKCHTNTLFNLFMDLNSLAEKWSNKTRSMVDVVNYITDEEKSLIALLSKMKKLSKNEKGSNRICAKKHIFDDFEDIKNDHKKYYESLGEEELKNFLTFCTFFTDPRFGFFSGDYETYKKN